MKLATLRTPYGTTTVRVDGEGVGTELDHEDVGALLASPDWRKAAEMSGEPITFNPADLAPVIPNPGKIICVGLNYAKHIREMGHEAPNQPTLFIKFPDALTGPYDDVYVPDYATSKLDYEGELCAVIGTRAYQVSSDEALDYVAGYAVMNDYSMRDFQKATSQFHAGKSFYRTAGFGPWLTTPDEWSPGRGARIRTQVDGETRQDDNTDDLIFSVAELIEYCCRLYPLNPGDVIVTGTPEGVAAGMNPPRFIGDGQTVRIEIDGLGHLQATTHYGQPDSVEHTNLLSNGGCCGGGCGCSAESRH